MRAAPLRTLVAFAAAFVIVPLVLAGCSTTSASTGKTTSSGSSSTGSSNEDSGLLTCGFDFGGGTCGTCVQGSCCSQWVTCSASSSCAALDTCLINCASGDTSCSQGCSNAASMADVNTYNTAVACLQDSCSIPCGNSADGGLLDAGVPDGGDSGTSFDTGAPDSPYDTGTPSGCAYSQCPSSVTCGSPQGSNGAYALACENGEALVHGQRRPASCFEYYESGPDGFLTFPPTYTCTAGAKITCNWPEGNLSCPLLWNTPAPDGGTSLEPGCCGYLQSGDAGPSCGIAGLDQSTGFFLCAAPGSTQTPE